MTPLVLPALAAIAGTLGWQAWQRAPEPVIDLPAGQTPTLGAVHFGGPDKRPGLLSDLLRARIAATPRGGSIAWATYYFRDLDLAKALIAASERGVRVTLCVDGDPRLDEANAAAIALLKRHGLNGGLVIRPPLPNFLDVVTGNLHLKIYAFSSPTPVALVGSFNPSGDERTDAATMEEIGDQDRGHNLLVEVTSRSLVDLLVRHVGEIARDGGAVSRFATSQNESFRDRDTQIAFYPRLRPYIVENAVARLRAGDHVWGAISHLKGGMADRLADAARRGVKVDLIVHDTERRVPQSVVQEITAAGALIRRYHNPRELPMHAKFFVLRSDRETVSYFGSLNFNRNSRWLNDELLVRSTSRPLAATLLQRFADIDREVDRQPQRPGR